MKNYFIKIVQLACLLTAGSAISQDVNPFNGSLNYGAPLLSVPSDRGNAIPIGLSYGGNGIGVSQPASEVGLGWGLSAGGSIIRSVSGIPDDFSGSMFNQKTKTFVTQRGVLSSSGPTSFDILSSRRNLDSTEFYFPNYDSYSVNGPGIGGSMTPMILNYMAFTKNANGEFEYDVNNSGTWKQPRFMFNGDFSDTLVSRHYPTTPVDGSTPFKLPLDIISGDYHNDATPYFGKKGNGSGPGENYDQTTNRLATANYVEYSTDAYGISSFTITNSAGFVYTYGLPVYSNSSINYSYPLNNDYSIPKYTASYSPDAKIWTGDHYFVEHAFPSSGGSYVTEVKESNKIPVEWKLTSITGPDYVEVGGNGFDEADKGYWVVFEYKKWTDHFYSRYPAYGFNYLFGLDNATMHYPINDPKKRSGKLATASLSDEEVYYLNSIKTSSHKAIFVRDVRDDEVAANPDYDASLNDSLLISTSGTVTASHGHMFDEGGATAGYNGCISGGTITVTRTVQLGNISSFILRFNLLDLNKSSVTGGWRYDNLHIYAGSSSSAPEISFTYTSTTYTSPFNSYPYNTAPSVPIGADITISNYTATAITFVLEKYCSGSGVSPGTGFDIEWHSITNKRTPQLFTKRVLLFDNAVTGTSTFTNTINSITSSNTDFNFTGTIASSSPPYNETWYQANKTYLDANILRGSLLEYDYSLAENYHKNINVKENKTTRLSTPAVVQSSLTVNTVTVGTGKLTLNKIVPYELGGVQLYPSLKFDYNKSSGTDNPDFDPRNVDYWGFYKSDASSLGFYGYTTATSKDYTDAWMLRKITSPMGGITELEYESNSYTKVLKGNGGFKGSSRIYPIQSISGSGAVNLEEGTYLSNDLAAVYNATASGVYSADLFVPTLFSVVTGTYDAADPNSQITNIFGSFTYTGAPLPIVPSINGDMADATIGVPSFTACNPTGAGFDLSIVDDLNFFYTGNGWLRFTLPVGTYTTYGAGSRVKKIISKNGTSDAYTILYEYEDGVALNEADRFTNPVARYASHASCAVSEKLSPFGSERFDLSPTVGYSKAKTKNLGQINEAKGWTETTFITSDETGVIAEYYDNFKSNLGDIAVFTHTALSTYTVTGYPDTYTCTTQDTSAIVEYVDKFSPYWGLTKEQKVYDANSNMLSRNVYEYETTEQGALVENFMFAINVKPYTGPSNPDVSGGSPVYYNPCIQFNGTNSTHQTCIKRQYPAVLKRTTSYGMGTKSITETLKRDELTGEGTIIQVTGDNNTSALTIKKPAFSVPTYSAMGAKSINSSFSNMLGAEAYYYSVVDSSLTTPTGSVSTNFSGASASVYTNTALSRGYDSGTNTYTNTSVTVPWFNKSSYNWAGAVGSIDTYGLYKKSELSSNPFNFVTPASSNSKWRFSGEISLTDTKGHTIETRSFNNKFSATKLDFNGKYVLSQISNCNYPSFTYTGFEYTGTSGTSDGEVYIPTSSCSLTNSVTAHTGSYVAAVSGSGAGPSYTVAYGGAGTYGEDIGLMRDRMYRVSVWTHTSSASGARVVMTLDGSIGGTPTTTTYSMAITSTKAVTIGAWKLIYADLKVPSNYTSTGGSSNNLKAYVDVQGGGTAYFDDLQFHPIETQTEAKVYDTATGRITAEINAEGYATKYIYDAAGRVISVYQEIPGVGLKLIKTNSYNYARGTN